MGVNASLCVRASAEGAQKNFSVITSGEVLGDARGDVPELGIDSLHWFQRNEMLYSFDIVKRLIEKN